LPYATATDAAIAANPECIEQVEQAASDRGISGETLDFSCSPSGVSVEVASAESARKVAEAVQLGAISEDGVSRVEPPCTIASPYVRTIESELQESFELCVVFGQYTPQGAVAWLETMRWVGDNFPMWSGHQFSHQVWASTNIVGSVSWDVSLYQNLSGLFLSEIDFDHYELLLPGTFSVTGYVANNSANKTGIYHIRIHRIHIEVPQYGYSHDIEGDPPYSGFRFLCNEDENGLNQCRFPDGSEAPWL
jgi:hypothetical protein